MCNILSRLRTNIQIYSAIADLVGLYVEVKI